MKWESFEEWAIAVYEAQKLGTIDPCLVPMIVNDCHFTQEELEQVEKWADEHLDKMSDGRR